MNDSVCSLPFSQGASTWGVRQMPIFGCYPLIPLHFGTWGSALAWTDSTCCGLVPSKLLMNAANQHWRYLNETYLLHCDCRTVARHCVISPSTQWVNVKILNSRCVFLHHGYVPTTRQGTSEKKVLCGSDLSLILFNYSTVLSRLVMNSWCSNQTALLLSSARSDQGHFKWNNSASYSLWVIITY